MKKLYEAMSVDVVKFEAQDVITASGYEDNGQNGNGNLDGAGGNNGTGSVPPVKGEEEVKADR